MELAKNSGIPEHKLSEIKKIVENMQTVSENNSASTSASVLMINAQGIMLSVLGHDYFLSYNRIPWMQDAPIRSVLNVQMSGPEAIEWPDLDVDLEIDSHRHRRHGFPPRMGERTAVAINSHTQRGLRGSVKLKQ